ncbi:MAG: D-alanyl-D-alanine carboxypeptidase/D-alanyl-D-alanine-endopeptidase [Actinomycetota bacterium]|nr:D-alanyl-D-alanine carboxypeptidase/D-alanyl-D-alanine-endopeptidase [Actinomycetota bacterium]
MRRYLVQLAAALVLLAAPAAAPAQPSSPSTRALRTSLARALANAGGASGAEVLDMSTGQMLFSSASAVPRLPASVEKVYTTSTALSRFGDGGTLTTAVMGSGSLGAGGIWRGTLYLRGGGDPTFGSAGYDRYAYGTGATMQRLVSRLVRQTGMRSFRGRVVGDESIFDSRRGTPATGFGISSYVEGLLSGLAYDRGFADEGGNTFQYRPALFAARRFADALRAHGVRVLAGTRVSSGRVSGGTPVLALVHSPAMTTLARLTNAPSDNYLAEMLLKGIGARFGGSGSTAGGARVVRAQLASAFGIHPQLNDGSGLSRSDHTSPRDVVTTLDSLASAPAFVGSLSVAGKTGTMRAGLLGTVAQGRCRGKTGTLHDVANLVGYCTARNGDRLAFAFLMNALTDPAYGHALEDRMAVALARYNG